MDLVYSVKNTSIKCKSNLSLARDVQAIHFIVVQFKAYKARQLNSYSDPNPSIDHVTFFCDIST